MTVLTPLRSDVPSARLTPAHRTQVRRRFPWPGAALLTILAVQVALAVRPGMNATPFEDEGLYIYMGHRMIEHLLHGAFLSEFPGAYFSGAPGFYPVLAALGDHAGGLQGARTVSLLFALGATVSVNGLGRQLYGRTAGLLAAAVFVLCGSVIYQSDFATFDSTTLFMVAAAAWLTVYSVRHDRFLWAPAVAVLLVLAFYAKYTGGIYAPVIAVLAVVAARRGDRLTVARRTVFMVVAAAVLGFFIFALWGQSLRHGIAVTTTSRVVINPASTTSLVHQVLVWVGPWLALAVVGAVLTRRTWQLSSVLLGAAILLPLGQIRIGESTSLAKHVAFGMIFAAPLVGLVLSRLLSRATAVSVPVVAVILGCLGVSGVHYSHEFMTGWVSDAPLISPLARLIAATPGKPILGDQPAAERYALRSRTNPALWNDTYSFSYDHKSGITAYKEAIDQTSFGVIYLGKQPYAGDPSGSATTNGAFIYRYLTGGHTPYRLVETVNRVLRGQVVGKWFLYIPKAAALPRAAVAGAPGVTLVPGLQPGTAPTRVSATATPAEFPATASATGLLPGSASTAHPSQPLLTPQALLVATTVARQR